MYGLSMSPSITISYNTTTRRNKFKLSNHTFHYDLRKYSFIPKTVNIWNSLPIVDVDSAQSLKSRLDKFWVNQDVRYDWTANLTGTGNRSDYPSESLYRVGFIGTDIEAFKACIRLTTLLIAECRRYRDQQYSDPNACIE